MAFKQSDLSLMAYTGAGGGNHLYWYTNSEEDTVTATGYFNNAADSLRVNDIIFDCEARVMYVVDTITAGVVAIAPIHDSPE